MRLHLFGRAAGMIFALGALVASARAADLPRLEHADGRYTLVVDGRPYFPLGAQVGNSSGWPAMLEELWPKAEALHLNTLEVPIYWEQMEPREGVFDDTVVEDVIRQARAHHVRLVLLWFGTWKNGKMHYVPDWVKQDTQRFPRMVTRGGQKIDVLSANSEANLDADRKAFVHLMRVLKQTDGDQHTVVMVQVENESGALGSVRDFSPAAQRQFEGAVPEALVKALGKTAGTWRQVFAEDADETFQAWSVARYIGQIAAAGKQELALPMYVNNWLKSPRGYPVLTIPGEDYPSGGPTSNMLAVWKVAAPAIDILAPDIYVPNTERYRDVMEQFKRPDNPLFIPETHGFGHFPGSQGAARNLFLAIGAGTIGFAPFGLDNFAPVSADGKPDYEQTGLAQNYELLSPIADELAQLQFAGKVRTAVEEPGLEQVELTFGRWSALVSFPPAYAASADTGGLSLTAALHMGRVMVAQLGPDEFLVAGIDARVNFRVTPPAGEKQAQLLTVEQGTYTGTKWQPSRLWNGDETDAGLNFKAPGSVVRVKLGTY
ncbi:GH35 family beta-galactosidase [Edaphobacter sp. HDX4]|uniref:GH35 family beta-galactosidase n=1 Tax=Edaphobacter sp. HDX4 TaxID=2794064 RepID=UPI002FE51EF8